jgi:hypothetical protein
VSKLEDLYAHAPRLEASGHRITSDAADTYNCVAWLTRDLNRWWEPGFYWPPNIPRPQAEDDDLGCYVALFEDLGYELCVNADLEPGFLKIAIYANGNAFHHVAKQLRSGRWSSKIGMSFDVRHDDLEALNDAVYFQSATATLFMKRTDDGTDPMEVEEHGIVLPEGDGRARH